MKNSFLPSLADIFRDQRPERAAERTLATNLLTNYAADQPQLLADLLMDADEKQFAVVFLKLREQGERGVRLLNPELDRTLPGDVPSSDENREKLAKRQVNAAVALLRMNRPEKVWPLLKHRPDPRARSYLIHRLSPLGADAGAISKRLDEEADVTIRRALLLSLGEFDDKILPPDARQALLPKVQDMYRTDADPGLHAAAEWLLRTWQQETWLKQVNDGWAEDKEERQKCLERIQQLVTKDQAKTPQWYVNGQGQTMVVIPGPVEFMMGSPPTEPDRDDDEQLHARWIGRSFSIASKCVTVEQLLRFDENPQNFDVEKEWPTVATSWYKAAAYCNWLSKQEGLPQDQWCYMPDKNGKYEDRMRLAPGYRKRSGYRLPTEAEWEYACRAGAVTSRYYGQREDLLHNYGLFSRNSGRSAGPGGSLKPNDLGFFDMHGNVGTWCQESYSEYPVGKDGKCIEDNVSIVTDKILRAYRGGMYYDTAESLRCAAREEYRPYEVGGFRVAKTFP